MATPSPLKSIKYASNFECPTSVFSFSMCRYVIMIKFTSFTLIFQFLDIFSEICYHDHELGTVVCMCCVVHSNYCSELPGSAAWFLVRVLAVFCQESKS